MNIATLAALSRNLVLLAAGASVVAIASWAYVDGATHHEQAAAIQQETAQIRAELRVAYAPVCEQWERVRAKGNPTHLTDVQTTQLERVCASPRI